MKEIEECRGLSLNKNTLFLLKELVLFVEIAFASLVGVSLWEYK